MKKIILKGKELERYFDMDADNLKYVKSGEITAIEVVIDFDNKTAAYIITDDAEIQNNTRNGLYIEDNFEGVCELLIELDYITME
jgi:hypothetical protein